MDIEGNFTHIKINIPKKSKYLFINNILYLLLLAFLWILFSFNTINNDRENYKALYYNINELESIDSGVEIGLQICMEIAGEWGLSYEHFQIVLASIFLILISIFIREYALNPLYCLLLYAVFPFVLDTIQLRNSISYIIIFFALINLYNAKINPNRIGYVYRYILLILFATLFHKIALIYFVYIIILFDEKKIKKIVYIFFGIELLVIFFFPSYINIMAKIIPKIQIYLDLGLFSTKLTTKFLFLILIISIPFAYKMLIAISHSKDSFTKFCYLISWVSGLLYIFYIIDVDFFRIYRNLSLMLYIGIGNMIERITNRQRKMLYQIVLLFVTILLATFFIAYHSNNIKNLLLNNLVL